MPNNENKEQVKMIKEKLNKAKSIVLTDYLGISSGNANALRQKVKEADAEMLVAKNTLIKVAMQEDKNQEIKKMEKDLKGSTAVIFSYSDAIAPIRAIYDFTKTLEFPKIKSAIIDGAYYAKEQLEAIKTIPTKEQLLGRLVSGLNSPISGFAVVLAGVQKKFVYAINAIAQKKGGDK